MLGVGDTKQAANEAKAEILSKITTTDWTELSSLLIESCQPQDFF